MEFLKPFILQVLTPECYDEFFLNMNFLHVECFKAALSKGLGIGIIAGSCLVKVPQLVKLYRAQSGEGINVFGLMMELFGMVANIAYSYRNEFPFSAWGEGLFLVLQTAAVTAMVLLYGTNPFPKGKSVKSEGSAVRALSFLLCFSAGVTLMMSPIAPMEMLWFCQASVVPLIMVSKMIQAVSNYRQGSTGQLSAVTTFLLLGGALARIFTSIQETGDTMLIVTFIASATANAVIASQMLYYWNSSSSETGKKKKSKSKSKKDN